VDGWVGTGDGHGGKRHTVAQTRENDLTGSFQQGEGRTEG
jgi:hypothetical protein